jgi:cyanophycinase
MFRLVLVLVCTCASALALWAEDAKGVLIIAGGGKLPPAIAAAFVAAAGGPGAHIAVLPTASGVPKESAQDVVIRLQKLGAVPIVVDPGTRAESEAWGSRKEAATCAGFWFTGGDQNRIADLIGDTSLHRLIQRAYQSGAVVGGTSAGAAVMSKVMFTGEDRHGKDALTEFGPGAYRTRPGLGFLPDRIMVDQHFLRRGRENRLFSLTMDHPDHLSLGIDEATALVVKDGKASVVGEGSVMVFDPSGMSLEGTSFQNLRIHLLRAGQAIDLASRKVFP